MRICRVCGTELPLTKDNFYTNSGLFRHECKPCYHAYAKKNRLNRIRASGKALRAAHFVDPDLAEEVFHMSELRKMAVSPELAERILSLPSMDAYSPAKLAKTCKCSVREVKSVLLNERRWRAKFEKEAVGWK